MTPQQVAEFVREARLTADPEKLSKDDVLKVLSRVSSHIRDGGVLFTTSKPETLNLAIYLVTKFATELALDRKFEELTKYEVKP